MVPYVISIAHPDYKRPYLDQEFGAISEELKDMFFIKKASEFILDRIDEEEINTEDDIDNFFETYYRDYYMDNAVWEASAFINNEWVCVSPSRKLIFQYIINNKLILPNEIKNNNLNVSNKHYYANELNEEEIMCKMNKYFEDLIDNICAEDIACYDSLNESDKILFILEKSINSLSNKNIQYNIDLFNKFTDLCLKYTKSDIEKLKQTSEQFNKQEDLDELTSVINMYNMLINYKKKLESFI